MERRERIRLPGVGNQIRYALATSAARALGSQMGRQIIRGVLGSIFDGAGRKR